MRARPLLFALAMACVLAPVRSSSQVSVDLEMTERIKDEGLNRSRALELYHTLTDEIGGRLPGSPAYNRAAAWARDRFEEWGLSDPRLEPFEFGRGWSLEKISVEMTAPRYMPLIGYAQAWGPSIDGVLSGPVVYIGDKTIDEIAAMRADLSGAIVLPSGPQLDFQDTDRPQPGLGDSVRTGNPPRVRANAAAPWPEVVPLLQEVGAGAIIGPSYYRDGTVGVLGFRGTPDDAIPSITVAAEQYNMMARLAEKGIPVEMRVELRTRYHEEDTRTFNVLADIPGSDPALRDEVVLIGAHLDSWHAASGATDNGDGVLAVMEAMRILAAVGARPRRTIRAALWSAEEQGLLGARAYIDQHLTDPAEQEKLAVYLNDDPGSGASLGFYMQDNEAAKEIFDVWLAPLADIGVTRNIIEGIGSTDHVPFDQLGLPAFNIIKDFEAYDARTRHTNADFPERMSEDELKQQAIFLAHFAWQAAVSDQRIPRAPGAGGEGR